MDSVTITINDNLDQVSVAVTSTNDAATIAVTEVSDQITINVGSTTTPETSWLDIYDRPTTLDAFNDGSNNKIFTSNEKTKLASLPNVDTTNPSNIVQDSSHRFVSDTEKSNWNNMVVLASNADEEATAFANGAKIVIRTDLV